MGAGASACGGAGDVAGVNEASDDPALQAMLEHFHRADVAADAGEFEGAIQIITAAEAYLTQLSVKHLNEAHLHAIAIFQRRGTYRRMLNQMREAIEEYEFGLEVGRAKVSRRGGSSQYVLLHQICECSTLMAACHMGLFLACRRVVLLRQVRDAQRAVSGAGTQAAADASAAAMAGFDRAAAAATGGAPAAPNVGGTSFGAGADFGTQPFFPQVSLGAADGASLPQQLPPSALPGAGGGAAAGRGHGMARSLSMVGPELLAAAHHSGSMRKSMSINQQLANAAAASGGAAPANVALGASTHHASMRRSVASNLAASMPAVQPPSRPSSQLGMTRAPPPGGAEPADAGNASLAPPGDVLRAPSAAAGRRTAISFAVHDEDILGAGPGTFSFAQSLADEEEDAARWDADVSALDDFEGLAHDDAVMAPLLRLPTAALEVQENLHTKSAEQRLLQAIELVEELQNRQSELLLAPLFRLADLYEALDMTVPCERCVRRFVGIALITYGHGHDIYLRQNHRLLQLAKIKEDRKTLKAADMISKTWKMKVQMKRLCAANARSVFEPRRHTKGERHAPPPDERMASEVLARVVALQEDPPSDADEPERPADDVLSADGARHDGMNGMAYAGFGADASFDYGAASPPSTSERRRRS
jgi:hypothetical protein